MRVYNPVLPYGQRAYGRTVTVINRCERQPVASYPLADSHHYSSEVVGRPLAALLANDGARVFSADIDNIQEYNRRPRSRARRPSASGSTDSPAATQAAQHLPHHVVRHCKLSLEECLAQSDTVITGVPSKGYKVKTEHLRDGVVAVNFSSEKNFESDIKDKVRAERAILP